jgi:hypothetical protein
MFQIIELSNVNNGVDVSPTRQSGTQSIKDKIETEVFRILVKLFYQKASKVLVYSFDGVVPMFTVEWLAPLSHFTLISAGSPIADKVPF